MSSEPLVYLFIPTLVSTLLRGESLKGAPLTEKEVIAIRDTAAVVMVPQSVAVKVAVERGYDDIDPKLCWPEWQRVRVSLETDN